MLTKICPDTELHTRHKNEEKGNPLSLAKANICLDAVATLLMVLQRHMSVMRAAIMLAAALFCVEL